MADLRSAGGLNLRVARAFFGAHDQLREAQADSIQPLLAGGDVVILAGTGSGKTEAAVAPLISRYLAELQCATSPIVLYLTPTRALVNDIRRRLESPLDGLGVTLGVRHYERNDLARAQKPAVLVTTPESLDVILGKQATLLDDVQAVILDEAHLLYNVQRGFQTAALIHRLELRRGADIQVAAMSATVADGRALWSFFRPGKAVAVVEDTTSRRTMHHQVRVGLSTADLTRLLSRYAQDPLVKVLVFADSRRACDEVADELRQGSGFGDSVFVHHSSLSKDERMRTESALLNANRAVCVATSTLELGIDIGDINLVVLWGRATGWQSLLQRVGRGGRRQERVDVLAVVPEPVAQDLTAAFGYQALFRQVDSGRFDAELPRTIYGAACQQILSVVVQSSGFVKFSQIVELFTPWLHLDAVVIASILAELASRDVLVRHPVKNAYGPGPGAHELADRFQLFGNFPQSSSTVKVASGSHHLADLPAMNLNRLNIGSVFIVGGKKRKVTSIRSDCIQVVPATGPVTVQIRFGRGVPELDPSLVESVHELISSGEGADVRPAGQSTVLQAVLSLLDLDGVAPLREVEGGFRISSFGGKLLNQLLSVWAGADPALATEVEFAASDAVDLTSLPPTMSGFGALLSRVVPPSEQMTVFQDLLPPDLKEAEAVDLWHKRPVYERTLHRLRQSRVQRLDLGIPSNFA